MCNCIRHHLGEYLLVGAFIISFDVSGVLQVRDEINRRQTVGRPAGQRFEVGRDESLNRVAEQDVVEIEDAPSQPIDSERKALLMRGQPRAKNP